MNPIEKSIVGMLPEDSTVEVGAWAVTSDFPGAVMPITVKRNGVEYRDGIIMPFTSKLLDEGTKDSVAEELTKALAAAVDRILEQLKKIEVVK